MFKKRWLLVVLISSTQLAAMLAGVMYFCNWVEEEFRNYVQSQVLDNNEFLLAESAVELERQTWKSGDSIDREVVDQLIASKRLPNQGYLCLVDLKTGMFVGHPQLDNESVANQRVGQQVLVTSEGRQIIGHLLNQSPDSESFSGTSNELGDDSLVSVKRLANSHYALIAVQDRTDMASSIAALVLWLKNFGFGVTLLIGLFSTCLIVAVLQRYDNCLSSHSSKLEQLVEHRSLSLMKTKNAIIFGLAKLAESRDTDTGEHLDRIRHYATMIAQELQAGNPEIDERYIADIGIASSLHDIGKVGIPDGILLKPGALTADERFIMEQHTAIGGECLEAIENRLDEDKFLEMARKIAYSHHERWDGTGYPYRLAGHDIPLAARIVAVADVYDALTSKRPYKRALPHDESKAIILEGNGTQFDPTIVDAFLACEEEFRAISDAQTGDPLPAMMTIDSSVISTPAPVTS